jgi:hypothetical protein
VAGTSARGNNFLIGFRALGLGIFLVVFESRAQSEVLYDEFSTGAMALRYHLRNNSWADFSAAGQDWEFRTTPPGSKESDRRLEAAT